VPTPLYAGRALILRDARIGTHLWFVLTDPDPDRNSMVLVMLVTVKPHTDRTLHLVVGDHPFVRHESAVDFGTATYVPSVKLQDALVSGRATLAADMSADLLARVRAGLLASARTPNDIVDHCQALFTP
jgi:hypothetical protein